LTFACATTAEERVAKRAGLRAVRVGLRVANGLPDANVVSFGLAGALHDGLRVGDVLDATRVVDETGATLWQGRGLDVPGARAATVVGSDSLVHDAAARVRLHEASGADAVDTESDVLARSGRLAGVLRVVSDGVDSAIEGVDATVRPDGRTDPVGLVRWVATRRGDAVRTLKDAVAALRALERASRNLLSSRLQSGSDLRGARA
jgi:nucleoside phosphorylase